MDQCKTIKFLEENIGKILCDLKLVKDFLDMTPKAQSIKEQTGNLVLIFNFQKTEKNKPKPGRQCLQIICLIKDLYSEYIKDSQNSTIRKQTTKLTNGEKTWTDTSPKRYPANMWTNADINKQN